MLQTTENILFSLKKSLLEYALKHRLDTLVINFACNSNIKFSSFNISPIRFELYNMHIIIKNKHLHKFDTIIRFLSDFNALFPNFLLEQLYARVLVTIKALHIFETMRQGDLKRTSNLIKEYFPFNFDYDVLNTPSDTREKNFGYKILKLRTTWNELILNKQKRDNFFESQFYVQYDDKFLKFLLLKTNDIIDLINNYLPLTQLEQILSNNFKQSYWILFNTDELQLELEDDVRLELFFDNLKLHKLYLENLNINVNSKNHVFSKYLKKIFKLLNQWELRHENNKEPSDFVMSQYSSSATSAPSINTIVHEMLYLGSQVENFRFIEQSDENREENELEEINKIKVSFQKLQENISRKSIENITNDLSNGIADSNSNSNFHEQNSESYITATNSFQVGLKNQNASNNESTEKVAKVSNWNDLLTDDEKENNLSY